MSETDRYDDPVPRPLSRFSAATRLLAALAVLAGLGCAERNPRPMDELVRQGDVFLDPETLQPYSGPAFSTFDEQPLVIEKRLSLQDGTYDGPYEAYFANRLLSSKEFYHNGRKHGPYVWYSASGRLFEEGTYHQGVLDGPYEAYWESGELYERGTYLAGNFDGSRAWYSEGELIELVTYANGVIDGPYERFDVDGTLDLLGVLRNGVPCGTWLDGLATIDYPSCRTSTE